MVLGLVTLGVGLVVPIHLRAVDAGLLERAGKRTPTLVEEGLGVAAGQGLGAAQLLLRGAQAEQLPDARRLELAIGSLLREHPDWAVWGGADSYLGNIFKSRTQRHELEPGICHGNCHPDGKPGGGSENFAQFDRPRRAGTAA